MTNMATKHSIKNFIIYKKIIFFQFLSDFKKHLMLTDLKSECNEVPNAMFRNHICHFILS
jgi:hypothetical protein